MDSPDTVIRLRAALKFTLWTWALYWPGGGLLLLMGGLDPISIAFTIASLAVFVTLVAGGALRSQRGSRMRKFALERPIYFVVAFILALVLAVILPAAENAGLFLFASAYLGGFVVSAIRLRAHWKATGRGFFDSGVDQLVLVLGVTSVFSFMVFYDALFEPTTGSGLGTPAFLVAIGSWVNLAYPVLLMLATPVPLRERLSWRRYSQPVPDPVDAAQQAVAPTPVPVAMAMDAGRANAPAAVRRTKSR